MSDSVQNVITDLCLNALKADVTCSFKARGLRTEIQKTDSGVIHVKVKSKDDPKDPWRIYIIRPVKSRWVMK